MLTVGYATLTVADRGYAPAPDFPALDKSSHAPDFKSADRVQLQVPGTTPLPGQGVVEVNIVAREALPANWQHNADPWCAYLDAEALGLEVATDSESTDPGSADSESALFVRRRQPGDRFCPFGLSGRHKRVSDLLVNNKVPAPWRDRIPLLVRADDRILWVCGWRIDERAQIRDNTSRVAIVRLRYALYAPTPSETDQCLNQQ